MKTGPVFQGGTAMGITYNEQSRIFKLDTPNTSYILGVEDTFGYLLHY